MCKFLSNQPIQLQTRNILLLIELDAQGMHKKGVQDPIAQMPQISCTDTFEFATVGQLPENHVNTMRYLLMTSETHMGCGPGEFLLISSRNGCVFHGETTG